MDNHEQEMETPEFLKDNSPVNLTEDELAFLDSIPEAIIARSDQAHDAPVVQPEQAQDEPHSLKRVSVGDVIQELEADIAESHEDDGLETTGILLPEEALSLPRLRLVCGNCFWWKVRHKGRSCFDSGCAGTREGCKRWTLDKPNPENNAIYDLKLAIAKLTRPELTMLLRFLKEALDNMSMDIPFKIGDRAQCRLPDNGGIATGTILKITRDRNGEYLHMMTDNGAWLQSPISSFTKLDSSGANSEEQDGQNTQD